MPTLYEINPECCMAQIFENNLGHALDKVSVHGNLSQRPRLQREYAIRQGFIMSDAKYVHTLARIEDYKMALNLMHQAGWISKYTWSRW